MATCFLICFLDSNSFVCFGHSIITKSFKMSDKDTEHCFNTGISFTMLTLHVTCSCNADPYDDVLSDLKLTPVSYIQLDNVIISSI